MDRKIALLESFNVSDTSVQFITDDTAVFRAGNTLVFMSTTNRKKQIISFDHGTVLDSFAVVQSPPTAAGGGSGFVVCGVHSPDAAILLYDFPARNLIRRIIPAFAASVAAGGGAAAADAEATTPVTASIPNVTSITIPSSSSTGINGVPTEAYFSLMATSRDGKYLATICKIGASQLSIWELATGTRMVSYPVMDDWTFLSFNPFNNLQLLTGHSKRVTVWALGPHTPFQLPTLTPSNVAVELENQVDRQIVCHSWVADSKLACGSRGGEILMCDIPRAAPAGENSHHQAAVRHATMVAAAAAASSLASGANTSRAVPTIGANGELQVNPDGSFQSLSNEAQVALVNQMGVNKLVHDEEADVKPEEVRISLSVLMQRLPLAHNAETYGVGEEKDDEVAGIAYSMTVTARHLVIGTEDGVIFWLNLATYQISYVQRLERDLSVDAASPTANSGSAICSLSFSPSFASFLALNLRGHLQMIRVIGDPSRIDVMGDERRRILQNARDQAQRAAANGNNNDDDDMDTRSQPPPSLSTLPHISGIGGEPMFSCISLGHYAVAMGIRSRALVRFGVAPIPITAAQADTGLVTPPRMVTWGASGWLQLWWYQPTKELLCSHAFRSAITSCCPSPDGSLVVVGLRCGGVCALDISRPRVLRMVFSHRLHHGAVISISFSSDGTMFTSADARTVYFIRNTDLRVAGYVSIADTLKENRQSLFATKRAADDEEKEKVARDNESSMRHGIQSPGHALLSPTPGAAGRTAAANAKSFAMALEQKEKEAAELAASQAASLAAEKKAIDDEDDFVTCTIWLTADRSPGEAAPITGFTEHRVLITTAKGSTIVMRAPDTAYDAHDIVLSQAVTRPVIRSIPLAARSLKLSRFGTNRIFALTSDKMLKLYQVYGDGRLDLVVGAAAHIKPGNTLAFTSDASLMATAGADGLIALWDGEANQMIARFSAHDFSVGGVTECCFSDDSSLLLTSGCDGGVFCWDITSVSSGREAKAARPRPIVVVRTRLLDSIDDAGEEPSIESPLYADSEGYDRIGGSNNSQVTAHNPVADKDLARRKARDEVARAIEKFRERFQEVMRRNERSSDLEQLPLNEFAIDVDMRDTLIEMGRQQVAKIRIEIETSCQGKELVASRIKEQCWDRMEVKGLTFRSFKTGNEISNFPLRSVPISETQRTTKIQFLRKMEVMETRWIRQANLAADDDVTDKEFRAEKFTEDVSYIMNVEETGDHANKYGTMSPPGTAATPSTNTISGSNNTGIAQGSGAAAAASKRRAAAAAAANAATPSPLPGVMSPSMGNTSLGGDIKVGGLSSAMPAPTTTASGGNSGGASLTGANTAANKADKPKEEDEFKGLITTFPSFLLYHPFACITSCRKRSQAVLLASKIETLKRAFNDLFIEFYALKKREIESISGKATRIAEIQHELQLEHVVYRPVLTPDEIADSVLYVDDNEVKAERILTGVEAEMKQRRELLEGMARAAADDAPDRALQTMMGGTLENKRDLSALELELSRQPWMELPADKMTEEQKSELQQFQKKVKLIEAERETRKKLLQTELSKLRNDVSDVCRTFDSKFKGLSNTRVNTQRDIYLHELMIIKIMNDLVKEERQVYDEGGVIRRLNQLRDAKSRAYLEFLEFKRKADMVSKEYEILVAEEKQMERHFRRDFSDAGEFVDYLARLYKTRKVGRAVAAPSKLPPVRVSSRVSRGRDGRPVSGRRSSVSSAGSQHAAAAAATAAASAGAIGAIETNRSTSPRTTSVVSGVTRARVARKGGKGSVAIGSNPLADAQAHEEEITARRAESDTLNPYTDMASTELEDVKYADLNAQDMPPQLSIDTWNRFLDRRRLHIDKELEIKRLGAKHYEMQKHLGYLQSVDIAVANEISSLTNKRITMIQEQAAVALNTELMLRIRQGQVEIEEAPVVTDLKDCEMLDRSIVESLNDAIVKLGREKVEMMRDITGSKTQIHFDNWQNKRLDLEHKDAVDQTTELQLLRVTKSLQLLIKMGGRDHQKAVELKKLDRKIDFLSAAGREQDMGQKLVFNKYQKKIRQQSRENERLAETVQQLEAAVKERQQISAIREDDSKDREKGASNRMRALVTRRKLIDLAKLQGEEIKFLKNQVETLRRRTFASFSIPQIAHNPDETKVAQLRSPSSMSRSVSRNAPIPVAPSRASGGGSRAGAVSAIPSSAMNGGAGAAANGGDSRAASRADLPSRSQTR